MTTNTTHEKDRQREPLRILIDLSGHGEWYRRELDALLGAMTQRANSDAVLASSQDRADCILRIEGSPQLNKDLSACFRRGQRREPREFVWDSGDLPAGTFPGFYVSLPSYMHDPRRHRAFCLPIKCNEVIRPYDLSDAKYLYGFFGAISSGIRGRMANILRAQNSSQEGLIEIRDSIWTQMFDRSGLQAKVDYAETMRQCRFNLCPRGAVLAGAGSRLYETMQAARVPVLISDWIVLPDGIDWDACSVRIRERDMAKIPQILRTYQERWPQMALTARRVWEDHFSEPALLGELGRQLRSLLSYQNDDGLVSRVSGAGRVSLGLLSVRARLGLAYVHRLRKSLASKA